MGFNEIIVYDFINIGDFHVNLFDIVSVLLIFLGAKILIRIIQKIFEKYFERRQIDQGRRIAIIQFIKYIVYVITLLWVLEVIGVSLSVLWGGAAALMVGIGLGLQQTFNDLVSGIILLLEGGVDVGDIIEVDGRVGEVSRIGIRTSQVETRDKVSILIPNSKIVGDNAINWSHNSIPSRFAVRVGVSYSSDIELVTEILHRVADENKDVLKSPSPEVQFIDFGNSSLDFNLFFYSQSYMSIESIRSDLRYNIIKSFRAHKIEIPFPQHDLWLRNNTNGFQKSLASTS